MYEKPQNISLARYRVFNLTGTKGMFGVTTLDGIGAVELALQHYQAYYALLRSGLLTPHFAHMPMMPGLDRRYESGPARAKPSIRMPA